MPTSIFKRALLLSALTAPLWVSPAIAQIPQTAAGTNRPLDLAPDSPFRDPDIIYLEADELINNDVSKVLIAQGEVEGRYQDRTLRAEKVVYNLNTGLVIASGNVVLIDSNGGTQYADKLELSSELEAGTASNFTARLPGQGTTAAAFATRTSDQEIELYNAYYTACELCTEDGTSKKPTWRLKARQVRQDKATNTIRYKDATFEFLGLPLFWTPYLAHPDPSAKRASGLLTPFVGLSSSKGLNARLPYFWAVNDSTNLTLTPHVFARVNPLMEYHFEKKTYSGYIDVAGSFTYASFFDRNGDIFDPADFANPADAPVGRKLRSHIYAKAYFEPSDVWSYGAGLQLATDDNYINRYDQDEFPERFGLYESESRRNISQAFIVGQDDSFRFTTSAFGYQDLRTSFRENETTGLITVSGINDRELPIVAPKIELEKYWTDPALGGRIKASGDVTVLSRDIGTDYTRATGQLDYSKTFVAPGGIEVKPFANARYDYFNIKPEDRDGNIFQEADFSRTLGQVGADIRYPFIKSVKNVDFIIEPRVQVTQSFGDGKIDRFSATDSTGNTTIDLFQDGVNVDLDQALFWESNKATGYDFWQKGFRADVGASFIADLDTSRAHLFVGKSFSSNRDVDFALGSGLSGDDSDYVGLFELNLNDTFRWTTRARYDDDNNKFRRIDTGFGLTTERIRADVRYYKLDTATRLLSNDPTAPPEEISGSVRLKLTDKWSVSYRANHDIDNSLTRRQEVGLRWQDDCTLIELIYNEQNFDNDAIRDSSGFGIRVSLLTLGEFEPD